MPDHTITIPVGDWVEEYQTEEPNVSTEDATIETQMERGYSPQQLGRMCVIAQQRGEADHFQTPKMLLQVGAARAVSDMIARRMKTIRLANGKDREIREFVAPVHATNYEEDDGSTLQVENGNYAVVPSLTNEAMERAQGYLRSKVPGHIRRRLDIIAVNGGDVRAAAEELKNRIDELVAELT